MSEIKDKIVVKMAEKIDNKLVVKAKKSTARWLPRKLFRRVALFL